MVVRRIGAFLAALALGAGLGPLVGAGPAAAGGWATTLVDPVPGAVTAGRAYEVSFWVLQHGTHPYSWDRPTTMGPVALRLTDTKGATVSFQGRALAEPSHFATTLTVPRDGTWRVTGVQGVFADYHVGTLTVPGTLRALGVPAAPSAADLDRYWPGPVRPPVLPVDQQRDPYNPDSADVEPAAPVTATPTGRTEPATAAATDRGTDGRLVAAAVVGVGLVFGLAIGGRRRWGRRTPSVDS